MVKPLNQAPASERDGDNTDRQSAARPVGSPDVVIVHGMWSTPEALSDLRAHFEWRGYRVHTPALPFHRPKPQMDEAAKRGLKKSGVGTYVAAVRKVVETLEQPPILIGHSMGGLIAQLVAQHCEIRRLILISSAAPAGINAWSWSVLRTFGHNLFRFPLWKTLTELKPGNVRYGIANTQTPAVQDDIFRQTTYESGLASFQIGMWFLFRRPPTRVEPANIRCPVLLIAGLEDRITPFRIQKRIAALYGERATLIELTGVCHWTIGGHAFPVVVGHLDRWLAGNRGGEAAEA